MSKMTFGSWLKRKRVERGLTQGQLQAAAELSYGYVSKVERGHIRFPEGVVRDRIHAALGTSDEDLVEAGLLIKVLGPDGDVVYVRPSDYQVFEIEVPPPSSVTDPPEREPERLPAHLRTSFMKFERLTPSQQELIERMIDELDASAENERRRLREDEP